MDILLLDVRNVVRVHCWFQNIQGTKTIPVELVGIPFKEKLKGNAKK